MSDNNDPQKILKVFSDLLMRGGFEEFKAYGDNSDFTIRAIRGEHVYFINSVGENAMMNIVKELANLVTS